MKLPMEPSTKRCSIHLKKENLSLLSDLHMPNVFNEAKGIDSAGNYFVVEFISINGVQQRLSTCAPIIEIEKGVKTYPCKCVGFASAPGNRTLEYGIVNRAQPEKAFFRSSFADRFELTDCDAYDFQIIRSNDGDDEKAADQSIEIVIVSVFNLSPLEIIELPPYNIVHPSVEQSPTKECQVDCKPVAPEPVRTCVPINHHIFKVFDFRQDIANAFHGIKTPCVEISTSEGYKDIDRIALQVFEHIGKEYTKIMRSRSSSIFHILSDSGYTFQDLHAVSEIEIKGFKGHFAFFVCKGSCTLTHPGGVVDTLCAYNSSVVPVKDMRSLGLKLTPTNLSDCHIVWTILKSNKDLHRYVLI